MSKGAGLSASDTVLPSFPDGARVLIVGAGGGVGRALLELLSGDSLVVELHAWSRRPVPVANSFVKQSQVDICNESSVAEAAQSLQRIDLVLIASGMLHSKDGKAPEKSARDIAGDNMLENFAVNTVGPAIVAKHVLPLMPRSDRAVFAALSARVGSIEDNRLGGWYSYRASKAALNQILKSLSIELARTRPAAVCVGLHPGTVDTSLSRPFQGNVAAEKLFTPRQAAGYLVKVVDGLTVADNGCLIAWDGKRIPF